MPLDPKKVEELMRRFALAREVLARLERVESELRSEPPHHLRTQQLLYANAQALHTARLKMVAATAALNSLL